MIISFEGNMGEGKTTCAVALSYTDAVQRGLKVISNIHLNFPPQIPVQYVDTKQFVEYMHDTDNKEMNDCVVLFDEIYQLMDSKRQSSKLVLLFEYYMLQTRKRKADMYICFHHIDAVSKRLRRQVNYRGTCRIRKEDPCTMCKGEKYIVAGHRKMNEKKFAVYKQNGIVLPVYLSGSSTFRGQTTYNLVNLLDQDKKIKADSSEVYLKPFVDEDEWASLFNFMLQEKRGEEIECERCLGNGVVTWSTVRFRDLYTGMPPRTLRIFGPAVWPLFDTEEKIPLTKQQLRIADEDL